MPDFFWFSDSQWSRIEPLLPVNGKGARRVDDRCVLSGIVHALQSGGRWGNCPPVYGPKKTLYNRLVRWAERAWYMGGHLQRLPELMRCQTACLSTAPA